jgi:hypothetical protein
MWKEIFFTIVVIWILFRLLGRRATVVHHHHNTFNQNNFSGQEEKRSEDVKIDYVPGKDDRKGKGKDEGGEYVDYEELK